MKAAPEVSPVSSLETRNIPLRFLVGEFCLGVARVPGAVIRRHFLEPLPESYRPDIWLRLAPSNCRVLLVPAIPADSIVPGLCRENGLIRYIPAVVPRYYVKVQGSFQEYLKDNFTKKIRYNLTRSVKKFEELNPGTADFMIYRSRDDVDKFSAAAGKISALTYQSRLLKSGFPETDDFRSKLKTLADERRLYGYLLLNGSKPVAFAYCVRNQNTLYYDIIGYDPQCANMSPGNVLLFHILKSIFVDPDISYFDFGPGEASYKAIFSTNHAMVADAFYFRPSIKNALVVGAHRGLDRLSNAIGRLLSHFGLKNRIRKWLRKAG